MVLSIPLRGGVTAHGSLNFGLGTDGSAGIGFSTAGSSGLLSSHNLAYDRCENPINYLNPTSMVTIDSPKEKVDISILFGPYHTHENVPPTGINVHSSVLNLKNNHPSGTRNMSRIDTASSLNSSSNIDSNNPAKVRVYATNYNVLRIMSGMGGLAYSN